MALPASRIFYWLDARDPGAAIDWAKHAFRAYYCDGRDLATTAAAAALTSTSTGLPADELVAGATCAAIKERTKESSEEAVKRGIFGSPFFVVDGEPFWGADRLPMVDEWLARGGW